jgi:hypothetical protein
MLVIINSIETCPPRKIVLQGDADNGLANSCVEETWAPATLLGFEVFLFIYLLFNYLLITKKKIKENKNGTAVLKGVVVSMCMSQVILKIRPIIFDRFVNFI